MSGDPKKCEIPICPGKQAILIDGTCVDKCPDYQLYRAAGEYSGLDQNYCVIPKCDFTDINGNYHKNLKVLKNGFCERCPNYMTVSKD